jgi:hypothetical protein
MVCAKAYMLLLLLLHSTEALRFVVRSVSVLCSKAQSVVALTCQLLKLLASRNVLYGLCKGMHAAAAAHLPAAEVVGQQEWLPEGLPHVLVESVEPRNTLNGGHRQVAVGLNLSSSNSLTT